MMLRILNWGLGFFGLTAVSSRRLELLEYFGGVSATYRDSDAYRRLEAEYASWDEKAESIIKQRMEKTADISLGTPEEEKEIAKTVPYDFREFLVQLPAPVDLTYMSQKEQEADAGQP